MTYPDLSLIAYALSAGGTIVVKVDKSLAESVGLSAIGKQLAEQSGRCVVIIPSTYLVTPSTDFLLKYFEQISNLGNRLAIIDVVDQLTTSHWDCLLHLISVGAEVPVLLLLRSSANLIIPANVLEQFTLFHLQS